MSTPHKRFRWKCLVYLERENYDVNVAWLSATKLVWEETRLIDQHLNWTSILYLKASPTSTDKQVSTPSCVPKSSDIQTSPMVSWISSCPKTALRWTFSHSYQHTIFNFTNTHTIFKNCKAEKINTFEVVHLRPKTFDKPTSFYIPPQQRKTTPTHTRTAPRPSRLSTQRAHDRPAARYTAVPSAKASRRAAFGASRPPRARSTCGWRCVRSHPLA